MSPGRHQCKDRVRAQFSLELSDSLAVDPAGLPKLHQKSGFFQVPGDLSVQEGKTDAGQGAVPLKEKREHGRVQV